MKKLLNAAFFSCALVCSSHAWAGLIGFNVGVNTTAIAGQSGFVDFTFLSGGAAAPAATATITNFARVGGTLGAATLTGNATGALPGTLTLGNAGAFNDIFQAVTFGTQYSFQASVNTPVPNGSNVGSRLSVSLYAADGVTPLLTVDPGGAVLAIDVNSAGAGTFTAFASSVASGAPVATAVAIPEPQGGLLFVSGIALLGFCMRGKFSPAQTKY